MAWLMLVINVPINLGGDMITGTIYFELDLEVEAKDEQHLAEITKDVVSRIKSISSDISIDEIDSDLEDTEDDPDND